MLPISILEKTNSSIVYEIPPGKPDPQQTCPLGEETRSRIFQSFYKGNTCWYYAFNFIRMRIGKNPPEGLQEKRKLEERCSQRRKKQTAHENSLPAITEQLTTELGRAGLITMTLESVQSLLKNRKELEPLIDSPQSREGGPALFPFIEEFKREATCDNMHEFLINKKFDKRNEINEEFLNLFGKSGKELFHSQITPHDPSYQQEEWEELSITTKGALLDFFARDLSAQAYGLKKSSWKPLESMDRLIEELNQKGPLFISGDFGKSAYVDQPYERKEEVGGRKVYAWRPGAKRHPEMFLGHSVLLIGAKKTQDLSLVYFIDPIDPSDPRDRSKQKIYAISFKNLTDHICDLSGQVRKDSIMGYAYHGNFKI